MKKKTRKKGLMDMDAKKMYEKLESYEQEGYKSGVGQDWLSELGEQVKFYFQTCVENGGNPTIEGLEQQIDKLADWFLFDKGERP